ncbi:protein ACCELERATED CELL DEATH 6-like protein isoform X2 [Cinnamomum micranthum f. kanehirae]|uniref:Protein ACCELERATED CELL DEATH 6-like protein isoform X2 n=1 Tax=Cinnamomum micranthum f. kanehirae TaxID=337451 RepID=A0A3S3MR85_9MAGN|nr:protein ACCELERATED CELL DEATH 6-like protein isoform X2 [Cinnamomum micranthum f. kanehirae]
MATTSTAQDRTKTPRGNMNPQLHKAAREGDIVLLTRLMASNNRPDLTSSLTPQGNTVLHIATKFGHQGIVKEIIKQTRWSALVSQSNSKGDTPLHIAARAGHLDLIKLLTPTLEEGAPWRTDARVAWKTSNLEGSTAVHEALKNGHGKIALRLLKFEKKHKLARRVNKAKESPLYLAAEAGMSTVVREIVAQDDFSSEGPDGQNPLHIAVIKGRIEVVKVLLESDRAEFMIKEEDGFEKTALHYASTIGYYGEVKTEVETRTKILSLLLEVNPSLAYVPDKNGDYPLLIATTRGPFEGIKIILEHCPDSAELVNKNEQNALHLAVIRKSEAVLQYLINRPEFKKLINEPDKEGNTPVHLATMTNSNEIVDMLSNCVGVDLAVTNNQGLTAMDLCGYTAEQQMIRDTLRKFGAVPSRHKWQELLFLPLHPPPPPLVPPPRPVPTILVSISSNLKSATKTLPIVTTLIATVTFAAAFTVPGGYNTTAPHEGMPVFIRKAALKAFVFSDILAFCSSMAATILLVYASACSNDEFLISSALKTSSYIAGVSVLATITAFMTGVYVLMPIESLWLAIIAISLGCAVPIFLIWYSEWLEAQTKALKKQNIKSLAIH